MKSAEALEDSPSAALHDLGLAIDSLPPHPAHGRPPCVLVGVTCGMSATYVGSQLESALADPNIFPVLVGFNPVERARDVVIPSWGKSFKDFALVLAKAHDDGDACLLNPVVGPEVVTGSTRMKSGSATKIILEIICSTAIACASASPAAAVSPVDAERSVSELINLYSNVIAATYTSTELSLPPLISKSSHSLRSSSPQSPSSAPPSAGRILYASDVTCAGQTAPSHSTSCPPGAVSFFSTHCEIINAVCRDGLARRKRVPPNIRRLLQSSDSNPSLLNRESAFITDRSAPSATEAGPAWATQAETSAAWVKRTTAAWAV